MRLPFKGDVVDIETVIKMVDMFMENGFTYFDTAYKYCRGLSEPALKAELLEEIITAHPEIEAVQLQINYLDWDNESIQSRRCYEVARKHDKPVIVMEPIKGGTLVNLPEKAEQIFRSYNPAVSNANWTLRFAASHGGVMMDSPA